MCLKKKNVKIFVRTEESSKSEITKFDHAFFGEEDIFRLDVSMNAIVGVAISDGLQCLPDDPLRQHFRHSTKSFTDLSIYISWYIHINVIIFAQTPALINLLFTSQLYLLFTLIKNQSTQQSNKCELRAIYYLLL